MTGPLLVVLHLIPQGVLAGLFFVMGVQALEANGITTKMLFLLRDRRLSPRSEPLKRIDRRLAIWAFLAIQLIGFGATFAITQTIAAIGFPIIILLLVPVRTFVLPKWFSQKELSILDEPTASPFTMASVGGNFGESLDTLQDSANGNGKEAAVQNTPSDGVMADAEHDSVQAAVERGEGPGLSPSHSHKSEREGRKWGESHELREGVNRRSVSQVSKH